MIMAAAETEEVVTSEPPSKPDEVVASSDDTKGNENDNANISNETDEKKEESIELPSRMKAVVLVGYNDDISKAIKLKELPVPKPGPNQVLVKVEAASVNPIDWKYAKGYLETVSKIKSFPNVTGRDCAGTIVAIGTNVNKNILKIGMKVIGLRGQGVTHGPMSEYAVLSEKCVCEMSDNLSFVEAGSVPVVAQTSYEALVYKCKLSKGNKILIFGGSSATGLFAIQIAKAFEASEIVVTSSQEDLCKSMGATKVYNYKNKEEDWFKDLKGKEFDIAYDCVGGKQYWDKSQEILKKNGHFLTIVGDSNPSDFGKVTVGSIVSIGLSVTNRKFWSVVGYQDYDVFLLEAGSKPSMQEVMKLFKDGKLKVKLDTDSPFSLDNFMDAFKKSVEHRANGKLVIEMKGGTIEVDKVNDEKEQSGNKKNVNETDKKDENENKTMESESTVSDAANKDTNDANDANDVKVGKDESKDDVNEQPSGDDKGKSEDAPESG